ncbi:bifunctional sugar-1-phosphate nucleotidylyltransferase/acetyltransferase [Halobellus captivus]|uniref:bifunctional sugar-1-phosphate nucleotidylyltransferase/acetyltransferase n=1 Tax=Halobellus captivus TaxID=2592614 RepID=UPI0011A4DFC9|nr:bifunctional sugar-1-phosphate nucleotidylyltransferase/acetyltransferase [Halobellus captivus]
MQAVILAAGEGTRIRPLSDSLPKPMLPVAGRPIAAHVASAAVDAGVDELIFVVGYEADAVRDYFGASFRGTPVEYAIQEEQAGTADAVHAAVTHLEGDFAVLNGDNLYEATDVSALFESGPSVACVHRDNPSQYGVLTTEGDRVMEIEEKPDNPESTLINAGAYVFPSEARDLLDVPPSERSEREITDVLSRVIQNYDVSAVELDRWLDVGRPWELLSANEWKLGEIDRRIEGEISERARIDGNVIVEPGAVVEDGVIIEGPVLVRSNARIGPNAYIRGATLVGPNVSVGHGVEVKNSIIMTDTNVSHLSYVGDSLLGPDVNFGAGTNVANLRHDGEPVKLTVKGERVSTNRRKFGVVAGPGAKTAINTSLEPGVTLSPTATTEPGERISRDR